MRFFMLPFIELTLVSRYKKTMNPNPNETDKKIVDLNIPVIYQSLSANTQNKLDRFNNEGLSETFSKKSIYCKAFFIPF